MTSVLRSVSTCCQLLLLAAWLAAGCTDEPIERTQIVVSIDAEAQTRSALRRLVVQVHDSDDAHEGRPARTLEFPLTMDPPADGEYRLPLSFGVLQSQSRGVLLAIEGFTTLDGKNAAIEHKLSARFVSGTTLQVKAMLADVCLNPSEPCDGLGMTCLGRASDAGAPGACIAVTDAQGRVVTVTPLMPTPMPRVPEKPQRMTDSTRPSRSGPVRDDDAADGGTHDAGQRCPGARDGGCDPIARCGCTGEQHCQVRNDKPACVVSGARKENAACRTDADCGGGLSCRRGSCRSPCLSRKDCAGGECMGPSYTTYGFCWQECGEPGRAECTNGSICGEIKFRDATIKVCNHFEDPCMQTDDGECDERGSGSGLCAEGTDSRDCCRVGNPLGKCDLVSQCGCGRETGCQAVGFQNGKTLTKCLASDEQRPLGSRCTDASECILGAGCIGGLCRKYCATQGDCYGHPCQLIRQEDGGVSDIGACLQRCHFAENQGCAEGTACARFDQGDFCTIPVSPCPLVKNGKCEEDSRFCAPGTDTDDCNE